MYVLICKIDRAIPKRDNLEHAAITGTITFFNTVDDLKTVLEEHDLIDKSEYLIYEIKNQIVATKQTQIAFEETEA